MKEAGAPFPCTPNPRRTSSASLRNAVRLPSGIDVHLHREYPVYKRSTLGWSSRNEKIEPLYAIPDMLVGGSSKERSPTPSHKLERLREPGVQEFAQLRRRPELSNGIQFLESRRERI